MTPKRCIYTENKQAKLREAVRLIQEVVDSVGPLPPDGNVTEVANIDAETAAVLRLVAVVIEDELSKHSMPVKHTQPAD